MDIVEKTAEYLSPLNVPCAYLMRPKESLCVSYHFFNEDGELYGDGLPIISGGSLQIDIFGKKTVAVRKLRKQAIDLLTKQNEILFVKTTPDDMSYEDDVKLYHQVVVFYFYYEEVN